jgi:hypothetical protein
MLRTDYLIVLELLPAIGILNNNAIIALHFLNKSITGVVMSEQSNQEKDTDGSADVIATLAIMAVVIYAVYFWLSGMPS